MGFFKNFIDGYKDAGELYSFAGEKFKSGNIMGGIGSGINGTLVGLGNTLTLGGSHFVGEAMSDNIDSGDSKVHDGVFDGISDAVCNGADWLIRNDAESYLMQDDLANGVYNEYSYNEENHCFEIKRDRDGNLKSYSIDKDLGRKYANAMGTVDVAGYALDVATAGFGSGLVSAGGKKAAQVVVKEGTEEAVEQTVKVATRQTLKNVIGEGVEESAELAVKQTIKEGAGEILQDAAEVSTKNLVKDMTEDAVEEGAETAVRQTVKRTVGKEIKDIGTRVGKKQLNVISKDAKHLQNAAKSLVTGNYVGAVIEGGGTIVKPVVKLGAYGVKDRVVNGTMVARLGLKEDEDGTKSLATSDEYLETAVSNAPGLATEYTADTTSMVAGVVGDVTGGNVNGAVNEFEKWLGKHPFLAKAYRMASSATYATIHTLGHTKPVAYTSAVFAKSSDTIKSWIKDEYGKYGDMSIKDIANKTMEENKDNTKTWKENYADRAAEITASIGISDSPSSDVEVGMA